MNEKIINVVGTMFFKDGKLLIDKPRKRPTFQMIGGSIENGETPIQAAIRECHEELGENAIFDENNFEFVMDFQEIATSDQTTKIHFYVFKYNGELKGEITTSEEIEKFWNKACLKISTYLYVEKLPSDERIIEETCQYTAGLLFKKYTVSPNDNYEDKNPNTGYSNYLMNTALENLKPFRSSIFSAWTLR